MDDPVPLIQILCKILRKYRILQNITPKLPAPWGTVQVGKMFEAKLC